jgi:hypothetical protein
VFSTVLSVWVSVRPAVSVFVLSAVCLVVAELVVGVLVGVGATTWSVVLAHG